MRPSMKGSREKNGKIARVISATAGVLGKKTSTTKLEKWGQSDSGISTKLTSAKSHFVKNLGYEMQQSQTMNNKKCELMLMKRATASV